MESKKCDWCGKEFKGIGFGIINSFCSQKCQIEAKQHREKELTQKEEKRRKKEEAYTQENFQEDLKTAKILWWFCVIGLFGLHRIYLGSKSGDNKLKAQGYFQLFSAGGLILWQMYDYHVYYGAKKNVMISIGIIILVFAFIFNVITKNYYRNNYSTRSYSEYHDNLNTQRYSNNPREYQANGILLSNQRLDYYFNNRPKDNWSSEKMQQWYEYCTTAAY